MSEALLQPGMDKQAAKGTIDPHPRDAAFMRQENRETGQLPAKAGVPGDTVGTPPKSDEAAVLPALRGEPFPKEHGQKARPAAGGKRPRLGFLGVGWIGRHRLQAIAESGSAEITAIADVSGELAAQAARLAPQAVVLDSLEALLDVGLDGIVIATPSALHADQAITALERGVPVFCQKPLGRTARETRSVISAARAADRLLGVDLSYRFITGIRKIHELCRRGELGEIYAIDLTFHNAYGPDKAWFYDWRQSGGGCVIDLGIHLVDLALWNLGFPRVANVTSRLFAQGRPSNGRIGAVEDYATARLDLATGATVNLACSWKLPAGCDAIISGSFYGTKGGAAFCNLDGSFYDFIAERFSGTKREVLAREPGYWGGRAAVDWTCRLACSPGFDTQAEESAVVAETLDAIYEGQGDAASPFPDLEKERVCSDGE